MKHFAAVNLTLLMLGSAATAFAATGPTDAAEHRPTGVVEMFDFGGNFGTLTRVASGVPRAKPNPVEEAVDRWRASAEPFTHGFAVSRGANGTESFATRRVYEDEIGQAHVRLSQTIAGLPVVGSELIVHADLQTGKVLGVNGRFAIDRDLARSPGVSASDAISAAQREYGLATARVEGEPELTYIIDKHDVIRLAWTNLVSYFSENGAELDRIYADALTGGAVARHPQVRRAKNREMYGCGSSPGTKCMFLFGEGNPDPYWPKAVAAYDNAGIAYDYFWNRHNRDGIFGNGWVIKQAIDFDVDSYGNAGWYPPGLYSMIVYGDGLGSFTQPLGYSLDIVGHEFTHGVIYSESFLGIVGEEGAINEGLADVFAVAIDAYRDGTPDWWIAEDVFSSNTIGDAMRYLDDPARQSGHVDYYPARRLSIVHESAGITGLAFYLLSQGGPHPRRPSGFVSGVGILAAEQVFYRALAAYMTNDTNFRALREATLYAAGELYGIGPGPYNSMKDAWAAVGNHWDEQFAPLSAGMSWYSPTYTTTITSSHTGELNVPNGANFDLYLERWNGSAWTVVPGAFSAHLNWPTELVESYVSPGMFRWRVQAISGSGNFFFSWNHPY